MGAKVFCHQGINVQWPFAGQIMSGEKVEEVRKYPPGRWGLPMTGTPLFLVQTNGNRYPREEGVVLGIVTFSAWRQYRDVAHFEASRPKHLVPSDSVFSWDGRKVAFQSPVRTANLPKRSMLEWVKPVRLTATVLDGEDCADLEWSRLKRKSFACNILASGLFRLLTSLCRYYMVLPK